MAILRSSGVAAPRRSVVPDVEVAAWHRFGCLGALATATVGLLASVSSHEFDRATVAYFAITAVLTLGLWFALRRLPDRRVLLCWPLAVMLGLIGASFEAPVAATLCTASVVLGFLFAGLTQARGVALVLVVPAALTWIRVNHAMPVEQMVLKLGITLFVWVAAGEMPAWLNARLREAQGELERLAATDPLTGLANRRAWDAEVARLLDREDEVAVLLVDLDHFKQYNDDHGHLAGDEMLVAFSRLIEQVTPPGDVAARWGGEEFALAVRDSGRAALVAEQVRRAVPEAQTCSIGLVTHRDGESFGDLMQRADEALYRAKTAGRDRVVAA